MTPIIYVSNRKDEYFYFVMIFLSKSILLGLDFFIFKSQEKLK